MNFFETSPESSLPSTVSKKKNNKNDRSPFSLKRCNGPITTPVTTTPISTTISTAIATAITTATRFRCCTLFPSRRRHREFLIRLLIGWQKTSAMLDLESNSVHRLQTVAYYLSLLLIGYGSSKRPLISNMDLTMLNNNDQHAMLRVSPCDFTVTSN